MAGGGVVDRPTLALIGEAGPEAVVPMRSFAAGGITSMADGGLDWAVQMMNNVWQIQYDAADAMTQYNMAIQRRDALSPFSDEWTRFHNMALADLQDVYQAEERAAEVAASAAAKAAEDQREAMERNAAAAKDIADNEFQWMYDHMSAIDQLNTAIAKRDSFGQFTDDWIKWSREVESLGAELTPRNVASGGKSSGSAPFYLTINVNAEGLISSPAEIGRQIVGAISSFESANGTNWRS
jgi:hypothetical protein